MEVSSAHCALISDIVQDEAFTSLRASLNISVILNYDFEQTRNREPLADYTKAHPVQPQRRRNQNIQDLSFSAITLSPPGNGRELASIRTPPADFTEAAPAPLESSRKQNRARVRVYRQ